MPNSNSTDAELQVQQQPLRRDASVSRFKVEKVEAIAVISEDETDEHANVSLSVTGKPHCLRRISRNLRNLKIFITSPSKRRRWKKFIRKEPNRFSSPSEPKIPREMGLPPMKGVNRTPRQTPSALGGP